MKAVSLLLFFLIACQTTLVAKPTPPVFFDASPFANHTVSSEPTSNASQEISEHSEQIVTTELPPVVARNTSKDTSSTKKTSELTVVHSAQITPSPNQNLTPQSTTLPTEIISENQTSQTPPLVQPVTQPPQTAPARVYTDQPDDDSGSQIHLFYVVPSDALDEQLDINGKITASVDVFQNWLSVQTNGRTLRIDKYHNKYDITFLRMNQTDEEVRAHGAYVREQVEQSLDNNGFDAPQKIYAVYYGGGSTYACGGASFPPTVPGNTVVMYLKASPPGQTSCASYPLAPSNQFTYWEFSMLHDILHSFGLVPSCAPHHAFSGHVSDSPQDLMYSGSLIWQPTTLDVDHDDYYGHGNATCPDLANSPYLT